MLVTMGAELFRKYATTSMIVCYRSVVGHPFLVGMIIFLFSMYRLFPLLFSILVSASPVLVSTAVLLGTLLSFGQPNIPEIEKEPESEIRKLETKVMGHTEIEVGQKSFDEISKVNDGNSCVKADRGGANLVDEGLLEFGEVKSERDDEKVVLGSHYSPLQQSEDEHIVLESDKLWEGSADPLNSNSGLSWKGVGGSGGGGEDNVDDGDDDNDDDDDDGSDSGDSGSDLAESSSPDASMADIMPMLDELHPLLSEEQETHQPSHMAHDGTDAVLQHSLESSDTSSESNDDNGIENDESLKIGDDEDDDKESEHIDKEDDTRSAITWTEDDQKNLMNLGTSEMERNRRLENLIARRRARKTMRMQAEKNLIDLESTDLPWNIPPISTSRNNPFDYDANDNIPGSAPSVLLQRRNPFDLPYDSSEEKPDLVGDTFQQEFAAFQPKEPFFRRHESFNVGPSNFGVSRSERQETKLKPYFVPERSFSAFQRQFSGLSDSKASSVPDTESVSSDLENKDHIEEDDRLLEAEHASAIDEHVSDHVTHGRPYFVPEHVASDETGFSSFQRQLSEVSESKVAESVSSDLENKDHDEEDEHSLEAEHALEIGEHVSDHVSHGRPYFVPEHVAADETSFASFHRQSSDLSDSKVSSESDSESVSSAGELENKDHIDLSPEPDLISLDDHEHASEIVEHVSEHVSLVSESFEEAELSVESVITQQELHSSGSSLSSLDEASEQIYNEKEGNQVATRPVSEIVESVTTHQELHSSGLMSSSDEASEQIYNEKEGDEVAVATVSETDYFLDRGNSIERSEIDVTSLVVDESQPNEPVYDLSPRSVTRNLSSSSISMDLHKDESFQQNDDHNQSSSSPSDVKGNPTESSSETRDGQNQVPAVLDNEEHVLAVDNISTSLPTKPALEAEDVVLDLGASHELEEVQVSSSNSHSRSHESVLQEDIMSQPDEESLLGRSSDKPLAEDSEELQAHDLEHADVALPTSEAQFTEVEQDISQQQKEVQNSENLQIQEPDLVEVTDIETKAQEIPAYASDTHSIGSNIDDVDEIKEIDEDLLVELDAVGDFSVKDFGSTLSKMKEDPQTSEQDLENKGIAEEDSYKNDLESNLSEMNQYPDVSEHNLETSHSVDEVSNSRDLGPAFDEMKQEYDIETKCSADEGSDSKDLRTTLDERNEDPNVSDHDLETMISGDEDSYSKDLGSTLDEMKQDPHASDHDLEAKHSEDDAFYSKDGTLDEIEQNPHDSSLDLETKLSADGDSYSKDATLDEKKQSPHDSSHDLETKHSEDDDSYSKDATLDEMKRNSHDPRHDLDTEHSGDEDSYSKDATLEEMKQDSHASDHDFGTKHSEDEHSYSKDATLDEMKQGPHGSNQDLETRHSGEDSYSKDLGSTLHDMKQDPHDFDHDLETEDSYSMDLDTTFNKTKAGSHALEHRLETFYSVDENFYSKHVESAFNETKQDHHPSDQDLEINRTGVTEVTMDAEVKKSHNENDINNTEVEGTSQAEASGSKLASDTNEVVLPQETESATSFANSTSAATVNHGTENASSTSNTDKE